LTKSRLTSEAPPKEGPELGKPVSVCLARKEYLQDFPEWHSDKLASRQISQIEFLKRDRSFCLCEADLGFQADAIA
jgi:hypothetical protein